ncbi:hypothetical protein [Pandoraea soli]
MDSANHLDDAKKILNGRFARLDQIAWAIVVASGAPAQDEVRWQQIDATTQWLETLDLQFRTSNGLPARKSRGVPVAGFDVREYRYLAIEEVQAAAVEAHCWPFDDNASLQCEYGKKGRQIGTVNHRMKSLSISDLILHWGDETGSDEKFTILNAVAHGHLVVTDPIVDLSVLDTEADVEEFLQSNSKYARKYWPSGDEVLLQDAHCTAILEFVEYGNTKSIQARYLDDACDHLCIRKTDFQTWLTQERRDFPSFWFSVKERAVQSVPETSAKTIADQILSVESQINAAKGIPIILKHWLLCDSWSRTEGLLLLSGVSPSSVFEKIPTRFGGSRLECVHLETLDGFEHDPADGQTFALVIELNESLWDSGQHPERAAPSYFIQWAQSKQRPPAWLPWAVEHNLIESKDSFAELPTADEPIGDRERGTLQKQIAALALVLAEKSNRYKRGQKPNVKQIADAIEDLLEALPDSNKNGLSSANIRANITAGIDLLSG